MEGQDASNDLAILRLPDGETSAVALFGNSRKARLGAAVTVVGYPLRGLLASGAQVTTGNISALAGIGDDARMLQFTASVQPGNSGGPLLDENGDVIGIVDAKLNALRVAKVTGDVPQNVNFAIKAEVIRTFVEANGIKYNVANGRTRLDTVDIADRAKKFTALVECWR